MKKIAIIEPIGSNCGMDHYTFGLGGGFVKNNIETYIYTSDSEIDVVEGLHVQKYYKSFFACKFKPLKIMLYIYSLIKSILHIKNRKIKNVQIHIFHYGIVELLTIYIIQLFNLKPCAIIHDVESFFNNKLNLQKLIFRSLKHVVVHNQYSKKELQKAINTDLLKTLNIHVIPHGNFIQTVNKIDKSLARASIGLNDGDEIVMFFGQIKEVKGLELLINGFAELIKQKPHTKLLIAGKPWKNTFEKYDELIQKHNINENVIKHIKFIPDDLLESYYCSADIIVLPYKKIYQSGVLLFAMSLGAVTVCSDLPAMREVVKDGENGYLTDCYNPKALCKTLIDALESNSDLVSKNAIECMEQEFNWEVIAKEHLEIFIK